MEKKEDLKGMRALIDDSSLREGMEGKSSAKKVVELIGKLKQMPGSDAKLITTPNCFLRALWQAESIDTGFVQDVLTVAEIIDFTPTGVNPIEFKDKKKVIDNVLQFANSMASPRITKAEGEVEEDIRQKAMLAPDVILRILINPDENCLRMIQPNDKFIPVISDFGLYEALMSINHDDKVQWDNLILLLRNSKFVFSGLGSEMTEGRRKHLREVAKQ